MKLYGKDTVELRKGTERKFIVDVSSALFELSPSYLYE